MLKKKESILGIISSLIAVVVIASFIVALLLVAYFESSDPGGIDGESTIAMLSGGVLILLVFVNLIGALLGFAGIFQHDKKKAFPVLGAFLNSAVLAAISSLIVFSAVSQ